MGGIAVLARNSLFRAGLVSLLGELGFQPGAEAHSIEELKQQVTTDRDIEILLFHLPGDIRRVAEPIGELRSWLPDVKVVALSNELDVALMSECFAAGATGYLLESVSRDALQKSLALVRTGEKVFPSELASIISDWVPQQQPLDTPDFSPRELDILRLLASGYSNKVIGAKLNLAEATVKLHLKYILRKTNSSNRTQAALWALSRGFTIMLFDFDL